MHQKLKLCAALMACLSCSAVAENTRVELLHYWVSPGEKKAVSQLGMAVEKAGGVWADSSSLDYLAMRRDAIERAISGVSPSAISVIGGEDLRNLEALSMIRDLSPYAQRHGWAELIHPSVLEAVKVKDKIMAIPITVHNENWLWFNAKIYQQFELPLPESWGEFIEQAKTLQQAGVVPLAIGEQDWVVRILFNTIMVGVGGGELHKRVYEQRDLKVLESPEWLETLRVFSELRQFKSQNTKGWVDATHMVIEGRAAVNVMGDWAKGEFIAQGQEAEKDFYCRPSPGAEPVFLLGVDAFALPALGREANLSGDQSLLLAVSTDSQVQKDFAVHKGSIPATRDFDPKSLDACGTMSFPWLDDPEASVTISREVMEEHRHLRLQRALGHFWRDTEQPLSTLSRELREAIE